MRHKSLRAPSPAALTYSSGVLDFDSSVVDSLLDLPRADEGFAGSPGAPRGEDCLMCNECVLLMLADSRAELIHFRA